MIDLELKQISKKAVYYEIYGISSVSFRTCPKEKLKVVALTILSQDNWLRSIFKEQIPFPANETSLFI